MSVLRWVESILLQLPMRVGLGGLFVYAAAMKIGNIQAFTFAIKGFKILDPDKHGHLIISAAYTMPWVEMIAGVLLVLGLWTRAAALTIGLMLVFFMAALLHVILDDTIDPDCSCFGDVKLMCDSKVGWCHVIRDIVMLLPAIYLVWRGGGIAAIDTLREPKSAIQGANEAQRVDEDELRA